MEATNERKGNQNKLMKTLKYIAAIAVACASLGLASQVSATTLTFGDSRDLGLITPDHPANPADTASFVDILLDQPLGSGPTTIGDNSYIRTTADPLGGLYPDAVFAVDLGATTNVDLGSGYLYLAAKYDGPNYGAEIWYVGGLTGPITVPATGGGYGLSFVYLYNPGSTPPPSVPDSGSTVMLLGTVLSGLGAARRFIKG
jgi:hypothetical protein